MPLFGLGNLIFAIMSRVTLFFLNTKFTMLTFRLFFYGTIIALNVAFVVAMIALVNGIKVLAPSEFNFAFGYLPDSVYAMFGLYMGAIVTKRILDFKQTFILHSVK